MTTEASFETQGPEETERLGEAVAGLVPLGTVLALRGDLASGKTCFVRGMARRFAGDSAVHSPTFTLVNEYGADPKLYHLDLYRLSEAEVADLGYEELFEPQNGVTAIEWAERAERLLPAKALRVYFEHLGQDRRRIRFEGCEGLLPKGWAGRLR